MNKYIIDRFEENFAVCEHLDGMVNVDKSLLPPGAKPGDTLRLAGGVYIIDREDTQKRLDKIRQLQDKLFK